MLALLGDRPDKTPRAADPVLAIETNLAEASRTPVQLRDREAQLQQVLARRARQARRRISIGICIWKADRASASLTDVDRRPARVLQAGQ